MGPKLSSTPLLMLATLFIINTHFCYGRPQEHSPLSAVVVHGSVFCDTCSDHNLSDSSYFIHGASVAVECSLNRKTGASIRVQGETDEYGDFSIELHSVFHPNMERCSVQLIGSPEESCNIPSIATSTQLTLTSDLKGIRRYSTGSLSYRPPIVPSACFMEDSDSESVHSSYARGRVALEGDETSKATVSPPSLPTIPSLPNLIFPPFPPLSLPPSPPLPSIPTLSVPPLPSIPSLPKFSFPPLPSFGFNFPPIPFLPPPPPSK